MIGRIDSFSLYTDCTAKPLPVAMPAVIASVALAMSSIVVVAMLSLDAARYGLI